MSRRQRSGRWLVALLPAAFRRRFGAEILDYLRRRAREVRAGGRWALARFWLHAAADLAVTALAEHREGRAAHRRLAAGLATLPNTGLNRPALRARGDLMPTIGLDLRYALRSLRRTPGFSLVALLTLSLGIGANVAIFSVVYGVLLKPLPFPEPERLMVLDHRDLEQPSARSRVTPGNFADWRARTDLFSSMAGYASVDVTLERADEPRRVEVTYALGSLFEVLQAPPLFGRTLDSADDVEDGQRVAVLSHGLWQRAFGGDPAAVGTSARLDGRAYTIVGVMPPWFRFPRPRTEIWIPSRFPAAFRGNRTEYMLEVVGRLAPGVGPARAAAAMDVLAAALRQAHPEANDGVAIGIEPLQRAEVSAVETRLAVLMGAAGFVLLVACANLAHLMLGRASARRREMALRQALGASRLRLLRLVLTESAVLALAGTAGGLLLGGLLLRLILTFVPGELPRLDQVSLAAEVVVATLGLALLAGLVFAALPALQSLRGAAGGLLGDRSGGGGRGWLRAGLVVAEVAFAVVLLAGAGLLLRSLSQLARVDPGIRSERILTVEVDLPVIADPAARSARLGALLAEVARLPGVERPALSSQLPVTGAGPGAWLERADRPRTEGQAPRATRYRAVAGDYFRTFGIELVAGRLLRAEDGRAETPAVVINQAAVRRFWGDEQPLGKQLSLGPDGVLIASATVVGVVRDVANAGLGAAVEPVTYLPAGLLAMPLRALAIRAAVDPLTLSEPLRNTLRAFEPGAPIGAVRTMDAVLGETMTPTRSLAVLLGAFASVGLAMAAVGVFGVLSLAVSQRRRELAIRVAIGADARRLVRAVVARGLLLTGAGVALGLLGALALTRALASLLYGVSAVDPLTYAGVAALLAVTAAIASYLPARRAAAVDPVNALRAE